jgi:hypothetical protein
MVLVGRIRKFQQKGAHFYTYPPIALRPLLILSAIALLRPVG